MIFVPIFVDYGKLGHLDGFDYEEESMLTHLICMHCHPINPLLKARLYMVALFFRVNYEALFLCAVLIQLTNYSKPALSKSFLNVRIKKNPFLMSRLDFIEWTMYV